MRVNFLVALLTFIAVKTCNQFTLEKSLPLSIEEAFYIMTPSGRRGGKTQLQIKLQYSILDKSKNIDVQGIYFKERYIKLNNSVIGTFTGVTYLSLDRIKGDTLEENSITKEDSKKVELNCGKCELGLKPNEAILNFLENGKEKFYKIQLQQHEVSDIPM